MNFVYLQNNPEIYCTYNKLRKLLMEKLVVSFQIFVLRIQYLVINRNKTDQIRSFQIFINSSKLFEKWCWYRK